MVERQPESQTNIIYDFHHESLTSDYTDLDIITFVMLSLKICNFAFQYEYIENI